MAKNTSLFALFFLLALLQTSFFVHFRVFGIMPNFLLLAVLIVNIFESPRDLTGIYLALFAGFLWDIFSSEFIGYHILVLVCVAVLIKFVLFQYVRIPTFKRY